MSSQQDRPGWDEYFMEIAKVVALRSNCTRRHVAAVIVKDKRIISTGYNGTPRGTPGASSFSGSRTPTWSVPRLRR